MALISCPECGHKVSDQAEACPNCAYPIKKNLSNLQDAPVHEEFAESPEAISIQPAPKKKRTKKLFIVLLLILVLLAATGAGLYIFLQQGDSPIADAIQDILPTSAAEQAAYDHIQSVCAFNGITDAEIALTPYEPADPQGKTWFIAEVTCKDISIMGATSAAIVLEEMLTPDGNIGIFDLKVHSGGFTYSLRSRGVMGSGYDLYTDGTKGYKGTYPNPPVSKSSQSSSQSSGVQCAYVPSSGRRCNNDAIPSGKFCEYHTNFIKEHPELSAYSLTDANDSFNDYLKEKNVTLDNIDVQYDMQNNLDKLFVLEGHAALSDYYNYEFNEDIEPYYFCMFVTPNGGSYAESWYIYCHRESFDNVFNKLKANGTIAVRTACMIPSSYFDKHQNNQAELHFIAY